MVAVGLLVMIAGLWIVGYGPFARGPSGPTTRVSVAPTFEQASSSALALAISTGSGPWSIGFGGGADLSQPIPFKWYWTALSSDIGQYPCSLVESDASAWNSTVPAFTGSLSSGESPGWIMIATNASQRGVVVLDLAGVSLLLGTFGGGSCPMYHPSYGSVPPSLVNSSDLVSMALEAGGSAFLQAHAGSNLTMWAPEYGSSLSDVGWVVRLSACPLVLPGADTSQWIAAQPTPDFAAFVSSGAVGPTVQVVSNDFACSPIFVS